MTANQGDKMRESKTDLAGVDREQLTIPLQLVELISVFFVGVATILSGIAYVWRR